MKQLLVVLAFLALAIAACQTQQGAMDSITAGLVTGNGTLQAANASMNESGANASANNAPQLQGPNLYTITKTEGDLVVLAPEAVDPDNDPVTYAFSAPFGKNGQWQTGYGDAGDYTVTVTASDNKGASTSETVKVVILRGNRPPVLDCPPSVSVKEGDTITLGCTASDPENDTVTLSYDGWMTSGTYTTGFGDAGTHSVTVSANDGHGHTVTKDVKVIVQKVNRPPVFNADFPSRIVAQEGDVVVIDTSEVTSPDGNPLSFTFSAPFDSKGVWQTKIGDAGQYPVDVVASDGVTSTKRTVNVIVNMKNTAPVLKRIPDITVYEGDTITLPLNATDRENDKLTYTVSGWMTGPVYTTTYSDAGSYTVKVTVSDGQLSDSQVVHITVLDKNRAPIFKVPA